MEEEWRDVPNYEGYYQVSNTGMVKGVKRLINRNNSIVTIKEKLKTQTLQENGYYSVIFSKDDITKKFFVHQLVAMAFLGHTPCGYKLVVNHINHIKSDNRVENLEIVTSRENCNMKHLPSSSKYVGVSWDANRWVAKIQFKGKSFGLGRFKCELEAANAYENALEAINNGRDIPVKKPKFSSDYNGVYFCNTRKKWVAKITINKKQVGVGYFNTELEAYHARQAKIIEINNLK